MRLGGLKTAVAAVLASKAVPHLSITDQKFTLISDAQNKKVITKLDDDGVPYCDVHIVDANIALSKTYYKEKYSKDEDEQTAPTCYSDDAIVPAMDAAEKQNETCMGCPFNAWGSVITEQGKKGKACRDSWKVAIIAPEFSATATFQFRVPPASLKNWNAYVASFTEFVVNGREGNVGDVITRVWFESQGVVNFQPIARANASQAQIAQEIQDGGKALHLIGLATPAGAMLPAPEKQAALPAPKKEQKASAANLLAKSGFKMEEQQENAYDVAEQEGTTSEASAKALAIMAEIEEEEDEEAALLRFQQEQLAEVRRKKQLAAAQAQQVATTGQPKAVAKTSILPTKAPLAKAPLSGAPAKAPLAGKTPLNAAPKGAMSLEPGMRTKMTAKPDAVDVEEEETAPLPPKKTPVKGNGIPETKLPAELAAMLGNIMGDMS